MTDAELQVRILKVLDRGPLVAGLIPLIVDAHPVPTWKAVRALRDKGAVTISDELTVRLVRGGE